MDILKRLKNTGTIIALTSLIILILAQFGIQVNNDKVMIVVKSLCSIGLILGVLNDPSTKGIS